MKKFHPILLFFCAIFLFSFTSCMNSIEDQNRTYLVFAQNSRAAEKLAENLTDITLKGNSTSESLEVSWKTWAELLGAKIELEAGEWTFVLTAYLDEEKYTATTKVLVKAGEENAVAFLMKHLFTVTFETNGGSEIGSQEITNGEKATEPTEPKKEGYLFVGWFIDSDFTNKFDFSTGINENIKLYAKWKSYCYVSSGDYKSENLDTIADALALMTDTSADYELHIRGELVGTQSISGEISANSITLTGSNNAIDKLNGNENGTTLAISTSVPVIIKNLTITGGKNESGNGGGISIARDSTVTLADGVVVAGNSAKLGGGVYNEGTLFMYDSAAIGDTTATEAATSEEYSNSGAGLYNAENAKAYLGYSDENTEKTLFGGSCYNYGCDGAGIYNKGTVKMASGNVSYNGHSGFAVGIFNASGATFELSGGKVSHNKYYGTGGHGGGCRNEGSLTMTGGEISYNSATNGAGVDARMGTFTMTGGSIKNNEGTTGKSIYYENDGTVSVKGKDSSGNDVNITGTTNDDIILTN